MITWDGFCSSGGSFLLTRHTGVSKASALNELPEPVMPGSVFRVVAYKHATWHFSGHYHYCVQQVYYYQQTRLMVSPGGLNEVRREVVCGPETDLAFWGPDSVTAISHYDGRHSCDRVQHSSGYYGHKVPAKVTNPIPSYVVIEPGWDTYGPLLPGKAEVYTSNCLKS